MRRRHVTAITHVGIAVPDLERAVAWYADILGLLRRVRLPTTALELRAPLDGERLLHAIERIRLIRGGGFRFVLPMDIGETVIADDVTPGELGEALRRCGVDT